MEYTNERPTVEGWYWYVHPAWTEGVCIEVFRDGQRWYASAERIIKRTWRYLEHLEGHWAGPLTEPESPFAA